MRFPHASVGVLGLSVILVAGCGGIPTPSGVAPIGTGLMPSPVSSPAATASSDALPDSLVGTWTQSGPMASTLVLAPCRIGERCGRFERTDDNEERCLYQLELRRLEAGTAVFVSADANSFGCGYSPWNAADVAIRLGPDDTVTVSLVSGLFPEVVLRRGESAAASPVGRREAAQPSATADPPTPIPEPTPTPTRASTLVAGWPEVSRAGITIGGKLADEPPPFEGCPAAAPAVALGITITGLAPGESVSLVGAGAYAFRMLGCGVEPSPCVWGSDTTDPSVRLCQPEYAQTAEGVADTAAQVTAGGDGSAAATLRFVMPEAERVCPAGASRPWYAESGEWKLRVTDESHGLSLVGPPDLIIGP